MENDCIVYGQTRRITAPHLRLSVRTYTESKSKCIGPDLMPTIDQLKFLPKAVAFPNMAYNYVDSSEELVGLLILPVGSAMYQLC